MNSGEEINVRKWLVVVMLYQVVRAWRWKDWPHEGDNQERYRGGTLRFETAPSTYVTPEQQLSHQQLPKLYNLSHDNTEYLPNPPIKSSNLMLQQLNLIFLRVATTQEHQAICLSMSRSSNSLVCHLYIYIRFSHISLGISFLDVK